MQDDANQSDKKLISLGTVLHKAALWSQAEIDAIPPDVRVNDEADLIEAFIAPADCVAQLILLTHCGSATATTVRARAEAWMEGVYWQTFGDAAA